MKILTREQFLEMPKGTVFRKVSLDHDKAGVLYMLDAEDNPLKILDDKPWVVDEKTPARATYYIPTWEDIFADDWRLTQTADSFVLRMEDEIAEVEERAGKLCAFFKSPIFEKLSDKKKELMHEQYDAMILYSTKVGQRLELEKKGE